MPKPAGPSDPNVIALINFLEKSARVNRARIWRRLAEIIRRPHRRRAKVNLWEINRLVEDGAVAVPGVVLGRGTIDKPITVAALRFSSSARHKITKAGGRALRIEELVGENPGGSHVKILI